MLLRYDENATNAVSHKKDFLCMRHHPDERLVACSDNIFWSKSQLTSLGCNFFKKVATAETHMQKTTAEDDFCLISF